MKGLIVAAGVIAGTISISAAQQAAPQQQAPAPPDQVRTLVGRLTLDKYKSTIKGLTQFGDRREGTERNRKAVDWIEAQLKGYGCETGRISYDPANPRGLSEAELEQQRQGRGGNQGRAGGQGAGRGNQPQTPPRTPAGTPEDPFRRGAGGKGFGARTGVNNDPMRQPDEKLRALNQGPIIPGNVDMVYCTKWGTTRRGEMYIIGGHMDGIGYGEAANDDGSGTAIVMELARILHMPGVTTDVSIRFVLWNNEETGLNGAWAYVNQREKLQGIESPAGSGKYPEPKWLGMIQHDMMMWDHGMPRPDGTLNPEQRPEADVNIEFQSNSKFADQSMKLAFELKAMADRYTTHYPATVGPHMTNTDSRPFQDRIAAVSLRENERGMQTGAGWNPHWHQPTDVFSTFTDKDFLLGLNAAQITLSGVAKLAGAPLSRSAGLECRLRIGDVIEAGMPMYEVHAQSPGELDYALRFANAHPDIFSIGDPPSAD
jgi:hypothetical protein